MTLRLFCLVLFFSSGLAPPSARAGELVLDGRMIQGGLVVGQIRPPGRVALDGKPVRVGASGLFVIGFGRDAEPEAVLHAAYPDGTSDTRRLAIEQRSYRVQRIDGLPPRKVTPGARDLERIRAEGARITAARARFTPEPWFRQGFIWPTEGRISGVYGSQRILNGKPRRPHLGVDVAAPVGTPVAAAADGIISLADPDLFFTGGTLIIDHGYGVSSVYSHLSGIFVEEGERVARGDKVAAIGATGRATGAHLDWRVNLYQERLDPQLLVGPMRVPTE